MKILAFAASNSAHSINRMLVTYAASLMKGASVEILDINDYEMPIFSEDREKLLGHPELAKRFFTKIGDADGLIISFAEHNGSYTAAYKNLFDWTSRINPKVYQNKPTLLLSTSPGARGAANVLKEASNSLPHFAADVKASISVPKFHESFDKKTNRLVSSEIEAQILQGIKRLTEA